MVWGAVYLPPYLMALGKKWLSGSVPQSQGLISIPFPNTSPAMLDRAAFGPSEIKGPAIWLRKSLNVTSRT